MKSLTEYLWFNAENKRELFHITETVREIVFKSEIK